MNFPNTCLFGKSPAECRSVGARGGRARDRNLRLRRAIAAPIPAPAPEPEAETVHEASLLLDERFPWLRDAFGPRRTKRAATSLPPAHMLAAVRAQAAHVRASAAKE